MKQNNLIITINSYSNFKFCENSIESIRYASRRWKSDFLEIHSLLDDTLSISENLFRIKVESIEKFQNYDKILFIDNDTIINSTSPNIFEQLEDGYDLAAVLDGNPGGRFKDDSFRNTYSKNNSNELNLEIFKKYIEVDESLYFEKYINVGVLLINPKLILPKIVSFMNHFSSTDELSKSMYQCFMNEQNILSLFMSHFCNIKLLDNRWNWIAPDMAGKHGYVSDHFDPNTGNLVDWQETEDYPPTWADNFFRGKMHPYIYHFCGAANSKNFLDGYDRWK